MVSGKRLSGDEVHRFRVMTKRMRAACMLAESVEGVHRSEAARADLRQLAKNFGSVRDGDVLSALVRGYARECAISKNSDFSQWIDARIGEHFEVDVNAGFVDSWSENALPRVIQFWISQRERLEMKPNFYRGTGRTEEKFRRRAKKAMKTDSEEDWHRCRRWAKYLYFQHSTLAEMAGEELPKSIKRLRIFASKLGKRNDLANLRSVIQEERKGSDFNAILKEMKSWIAKRDAAYEESTKDFIFRRLNEKL